MFPNGPRSILDDLQHLTKEEPLKNGQLEALLTATSPESQATLGKILLEERQESQGIVQLLTQREQLLTSLKESQRKHKALQYALIATLFLSLISALSLLGFTLFFKKDLLDYLDELMPQKYVLAISNIALMLLPCNGFFITLLGSYALRLFLKYRHPFPFALLENKLLALYRHPLPQEESTLTLQEILQELRQSDKSLKKLSVKQLTHTLHHLGFPQIKNHSKVIHYAIKHKKRKKWKRIL